MATRTFSSRVDEDKLQLANAISQRDAGMSFGQFCGTSIVDYICEHNALPPLHDKHAAQDGFAVLRQLAERHGDGTTEGDPSIAQMSDAEIKELIARRYA